MLSFKRIGCRRRRRRQIVILSAFFYFLIGYFHNSQCDNISIGYALVHAFIITDKSFLRLSSSSLLRLQHAYDDSISRRIMIGRNYDNFFSERNNVGGCTNRNTFQKSSTILLRHTGSQLQMCICINCSRVINCTAYHFVETKHEQPHITTHPTFTPRDGSPTIHVNVRTNRLEMKNNNTRDDEPDPNESNKYSLLEENNTRQNNVMGNGISEILDQNTKQEATIDHQHESMYSNSITPITTYEYDVVACEDYVEDMHCWIRNMPEEIKRANPSFVPT
jgi:hypothetical protein